MFTFLAMVFYVFLIIFCKFLICILPVFTTVIHHHDLFFYYYYFHVNIDSHYCAESRKLSNLCFFTGHKTMIGQITFFALGYSLEIPEKKKNNDSKQIVLATNLSELLTLKKYFRGFLQVFAISLLCQKIEEFI